MMAIMDIVKSFLFGEDLDRWKIDAGAQYPTPLQVEEEVDYSQFYRVTIEGSYMYHDASRYDPSEFNELATRVSGMQIFGTAFIISRRETDFLKQCQRAPALPVSFRLKRPTYPCSQ